MRRALLAVLLGAAALPATARPFRLEDVVAFRTVREAAVSPDRKRVALLVREADLAAGRFRNGLWLVAADGSAPARRIEASPVPESSLRWSPDGARIGYLGRRALGSQVFAVSIRGGPALAVTSHGASVAAFEWGPRGGLLAVGPAPTGEEQRRREKTRDDASVVGRHWRNHRAWLVSRAGAFSPLTDGTRHVQRAALSPDGSKVALITTPDPEADSSQEARLQVLELGSGKTQEVPGSSLASDVEWAPDGRALAFVRPFDGREISRADLFLWTPGDAAARNVSSALDRDVEALRWSPDAAAVDAQLPEGARSTVVRFLVGAGSGETLWKPAHGLALLDRAGPGWVYVPSDRPHELWSAGPQGQSPRRLTRLNPDDIELPRVELVRWRSGEREVEGVLFAPAGESGGSGGTGESPQLNSERGFIPRERYDPRPLVLHPHGGPRDHAGDDFDPLAAYLVAQGFLVLKPNFRGSTGYGDAFTRGNVEDWGVGPLADVMSGADALIARGLADPNRLFLYGWSYGGYLANWAVTHTDRLRAAVSGAGVADLRMQYSISDARRWRFDYFRGSPFAGHEELYARQSPVTYARQARVPTLFLHGEKDERCPPSQGFMMYRALRDNGVETEMVLYPREPHVFVEPQHLIDRARRVGEWFRAHDRQDAGREDSNPPAIVQLHHERLKPGAEAAYSKNEEGIAGVCARFKCPNPYLALESVAGPKEVWWLNAFASEADRDRVGRAYEQNVEVTAALRDLAERKKQLLYEPEDFVATYLRDLSHECSWRIAGARFFVVTVTNAERKADGCVFDAPPATRFVIAPVATRAEADRRAAAAAPHAKILAIRPAWSLPAAAWIAADPDFWRTSPAARTH